MSVEAAADRLPWLADEPVPSPTKRRRQNLLPFTGAMIAIVAAAGFWLGARSVQPSGAPAVRDIPPSTTVRVPPAIQAPAAELPIAPQPEVRPAPAPEVHPAPSRQVRIPSPAPPAPAFRQNSRTEVRVHRREITPSAASVAPSAVPNHPGPGPIVPVMWNPRVVTGSSGRLVQVGAFGSIHQAKRGWWFMVRDYPAMAHLPAVVRMTRNSKGRAFYRFDVGTTSQAHSEVLCQRMSRISLSCAVVGLPWKAKVER